MRHGNNRLLAGAALASSLFTGGGCVEPTAGPPFVESVSQPLSASGSLEIVANYNTTMTHGAVAAASMTSARFVTVGKAGATGQLHLGLWQLKDGGSVRSLASLTTSTKVGLTLDVARVDDKRFVVAARRADGDYYLGAFSIDPTTNAIKQTDDEERGAIDDISITGMNPVPGDLVIGAPSGAASEGHVVVAHRSSISGELGLTDYSVTAAGLLRRNGSASGGDISAVKITTVAGGQPPAAILSRKSGAERCDNGIDDDGDDHPDSTDWDCCATAAHAGSSACVQGTVVTATTSSSGADLKLISWKVSATGQITRLGSAYGGAASSFDLSPQSFRRIATVTTTTGQPEVSTWDVDPTTGGLARHSTYSPARPAAGVRVVNGGGARSS